MQQMLLNEIKNIHKALLVEIVASLGLAELEYKHGDAMCVDGSIWSDDDLYTLIEDYVVKSTESELEDTLTLSTCLIISVTQIKYDTSGDDEDDFPDLPDELTFIVYPDDDDLRDGEMEYVENILDDLVSDKTGFCFYSCEYIATKYEPYKGENNVN